MSANQNKEKLTRRYTAEEKEKVIAFINDYKTKNGRGAQKAAAAKFGISAVTITNWMKTSKKKRGRKVGSKNSTSSKTASLIKSQNPADLRRLATLLDDIHELEAKVAELDSKRQEAEEISARLFG